jgi:hypothetical protein
MCVFRIQIELNFQFTFGVDLLRQNEYTDKYDYHLRIK